MEANTTTPPEHTGNNGAQSARKGRLMASTTSILTLAALHADDASPMASSAESCIREAREAVERGADAAARRWALKSLAYSIGVFHADYQWAAA